MEDQKNEPIDNPQDSGNKNRGISLSGRKIFFTLLLLVVVLTMYIGTYYKIVHYGP
ncbi:MAG: hypothetical protein OEW37_01715 [Rhodospirillaceae bacterium]|nr:hypothetical protein [Rhodospirillaceae bacterium]